jgi:hypothetical protein
MLSASGLITYAKLPNWTVNLGRARSTEDRSRATATICDTIFLLQVTELSRLHHTFVPPAGRT